MADLERCGLCPNPCGERLMQRPAWLEELLSDLSDLHSADESPSLGQIDDMMLAISQRVEAAASQLDDYFSEPLFAQDRPKVTIVDRPDLSLYLLGFQKGQRTGIHDHGGAEGAFKVLSGTLHEARYVDQDPLPNGQIIARERVVERRAGMERQMMTRDWIHNLVNYDTATVVSLHAYWPQLTQMTGFDRDRYGQEGIALSPRPTPAWENA